MLQTSHYDFIIVQIGLPIHFKSKTISEFTVCFSVLCCVTWFSVDVMQCVVSLIARGCTLSVMESLLWEAR